MAGPGAELLGWLTGSGAGAETRAAAGACAGFVAEAGELVWLGQNVAVAGGVQHKPAAEPSPRQLVVVMLKRNQYGKRFRDD